ncbi:hypothetical protein GCM10022222_46450 [Amycolatopsis ultiminotia]|uniref:Uncharacterized protein n=1 Tax=Amycolatopsis ultiminotia TaxID=543629 RepID=A0ABP6WYM0_9PSEU
MMGDSGQLRTAVAFEGREHALFAGTDEFVQLCVVGHTQFNPQAPDLFPTVIGRKPADYPEQRCLHVATKVS